MLEYIDFANICSDYKLTTGDLSPHQQLQLEILLTEFINQNK